MFSTDEKMKLNLNIFEFVQNSSRVFQPPISVCGQVGGQTERRPGSVTREGGGEGEGRGVGWVGVGGGVRRALSMPAPATQHLFPLSDLEPWKKISLFPFKCFAYPKIILHFGKYAFRKKSAFYNLSHQFPKETKHSRFLNLQSFHWTLIYQLSLNCGTLA